MTSPIETKSSGSREGLTEYLIVIAVLLLVVVGLFAVFGPEIRALFGIGNGATAP